MTTRSPIVSVLGHVDHGKSSILDMIRESAIVKTEAGQITQAIGASIIPLEVIKKKCGTLLKSVQLTIPGLLFIDTPGHAAFMGMRKRGGSLADMAILVIDINEGFRPQTVESIKILKANKTPFLIALNKLDLVPGYRKASTAVVQDIGMQEESVQQHIENKLYEVVGNLYEQFGMQAERFDRCDFAKQIALVPCSAKSGQGLPELLMVLIGLSQKYLQDSLQLDVQGQAKGNILEVKEEKGLGTCLNVILYDGTLSVNDTIVIGGIDKPIITTVKALFEPLPLQEMRDKKSKYESVESVSAATGVRIAAQNIDGAIAGMPLLSCTPETIEEAKEAVMEDVEALQFDDEGVCIKADTLGSLEALATLLREAGIPVRKGSIGNITKKDAAEVDAEKEPTYKVIVGFNIKDESESAVKSITNDVIYRLIDDIKDWQESVKKREEAKQLDTMTRPCKVEVLQNCIFRQSNPAVVGVEVLGGMLKIGTALTKDGTPLTIVKSMQKEKESVALAERKDQLAISLPNIICGRHLFEHDILYSDISEIEFRELKKLKKFLSREELEIMRELAEMHRKTNVLWGV